MKRFFAPLTLVAASLLGLCPPAVLARGEPDTWVGRSVDDRSVFLTVTRLEGNDWALRRNGSNLGEYTAVANTGSYLELRAKGGSETIRLYADRMEVSGGSGSRFLTLARGSWQ